MFAELIEGGITMKARTALVVGTAVATMLAVAVPAEAGNRKRQPKKAAPVVAPANDAFAAGTEILEMPFETVVDLRGSSLETSEPMPSCSEATATVWYRFTPTEDLNLVGSVASSSPVGVSIYSGADLATLSEVACAAAAPEAHIAMPATGGSVYFVQVSVPKRRPAAVEFSLKVDTWRHKELTRQNVVVPVPAVEQAAVVVDGKPRESNPNIYDLTIKAADVTIGPYGVETNPVTLPAIHQELLKVPGQTVDVSVTSSYRYDSAQGRCVLYQGEECLKRVPVAGDTGWYTGGDGAEAELIVTLTIKHNDRLLAERTVSVPFAGQVGSLIP